MTSTDDRVEILRLDAEWSDVAGTRNVERILSYWSDDATLLPPGSPPIVGKAAIREYIRGSFEIPGFRVSWKTRDVVVSDDRDMAYGIGTNQVSFSGPDGKPVVLDGNAVTVWRRGPSGWKCVVDIWNSP